MARSAAKTKNSRQDRGGSSTGKGGSARALALGTLSLGAVAAVAAYALRKLGGRTYVAGEPLAPTGEAPAAPGLPAGSGAEHVPTDLMGSGHPGPEDRAPEAFRPDPTAPVPEGERDAFRPALAGAAAPTLVKGEARENERLDAAPS